MLVLIFGAMPLIISSSRDAMLASTVGWFTPRLVLEWTNVVF